MNYRRLIIGVLIFFSLFLSNSGLVAYAQYDDFGGYDYYYEDSYDYPYVYYDYDYGYDYDYNYYSYDNSYIVSAHDYTSYAYPMPTYSSVNNYPVAPHQNYSYSLPPTPSVNNYPVAPYQNYNYPPIPIPGVNDYPVASYGNYSYPSLPYPAITNYPISFGGYQNLTTPSALAAFSGETVAHAQSVSEVPTGPDGTLPWIFIGGLALSIAVYLILLKIRFGFPFRFSENYSGAVLEKRLREIRNIELTPDTNDFQF